MNAASPKAKQLTEQGTSVESEQNFLRQIALECRRAERSKQRFVVALLGGLENMTQRVQTILDSLSKSTRETDVWGWYEEGITLGILFTELGTTSPESARDTIQLKLQTALKQSGLEELEVVVHILPFDLTQSLPQHDHPVRGRLEAISSPRRKFLLGIKRAIDITGSALLLLLLWPLMLAIALAIKCSSPGPVLFRQSRVGQGGRHFTFLKFRSMTVASDQSLHQNYVTDFIRGTAAKHKSDTGQEVFKLTQDPRVTSLGRFLRKSSFDELPQLWNVLRGDMSLVGPRPPIPYEVACYELWHQRRVLELKPGITGLWQVSGRNHTGFNDMVRLDLQYARSWSPWLDVKILLQTPYAVINGGGAH